MTQLSIILALALLPLFAEAQGLSIDTSECARMNRMMSLRLMVQEETILRQQKQINLFSDAVIYGKPHTDLIWDVNVSRIKRERNIFAGSTGLLLIAIATVILSKK